MLETVNKGITKNISGIDIEILSHNFHNPHCNIVCTYFLDKDCNKIELTYYKNINTGEEGHELYKFKSSEELGHYWSRNFSNREVPAKYKELAGQLKEVFKKINFEDYKARN